MKRKRVSGPDDGPSSRQKKPSGIEILKLYSMTLHPYETYLSLFKRLSKQADKCNLTKCRDNTYREVLRGRLIPLVKDTELQQQLANADNHCLQDILTKYSVPQTITHVLSLVFPYVSLAELHAVSQINIGMKALVQEYLSSGQNLTIDKKVLQKYPVKNNHDIYKNYGSMTKCLTVKDFPQTQLVLIISMFPNLEGLQLIEITNIIKELPEVPRTLRSLHLVRSRIKHRLLKEWFRTGVLSHVLETLYIDNLTYIGKSPADRYDLELSKLGQLKSLTLKGEEMNVGIDIPRLKVLKIIATKLGTSDFTCPELETLVFDFSVENFMYELPWTRLKSLTLHYFKFKWINDCPDLEYLRVVRSVDPIHLDKLTRIKALDLHMYTPSNTQNVIVDTLPDDMLITIAGYLSVENCISFAGSHPRFCRVMAMVPKCTKTELLLRPGYPQAAIDRGFQYSLVTKVKIVDFPEIALVDYLPHFTRMTTLCLAYSSRACNISHTLQVQPIGKLPMLKSLTITRRFDFCSFSNVKVPTFILASFGPQLTELSIIYDPLFFGMNFGYISFPKLEHIHLISNVTDPYISERNLEIFGQMTSIRKLTICTSSWYFESVLQLIKCWTGLVEITLAKRTLDEPNAEELSSYLRENNRKLTINNIEY